MDRSRRLEKILLLLFSIIAFGIIGFMALEGRSFLDALYLTIITMSTVGFGDVHGISPIGKIFIIILIVLGVGSFFYSITSSAEYLIAGQFKGVLGRRKMKKQVDALNDHYIICGLGRVGEQVANELSIEKVPFVILDKNEDAIQRCISKDYLFIEGDASRDETLKEAGVLRAKGLVASTNSDADNVYLILSAKSLNSKLFVVARANLKESRHKLHRAGADRVISPYAIGGRRLANLLLRPAVIEFLDEVMHSDEKDLFIEEIVVHERSSLIGATISEARAKYATYANILAIKKKGEKMITLNPVVDASINKGDRLIAIGTRGQLKELEGLT